MSGSEDLFDEGVPFNIDPSPASVGSTPLEFSDTVVGPSSSSLQQQPKPVGDGRPIFPCTVCLKELKTKSGYTRHMMRHKLDDYASRAPWKDDVKLQLPQLFDEVLAIIKVEPTVSELKVSWTLKLIEALAESNQKNQWIEFLAEPIINCICKQTKVIPSAQFEEAIREHNCLMCDGSYLANCTSLLFLCVPNELKSCPGDVVSRFIWRVSTQLMYKIQEFIFKKMKHDHVSACLNYVMNEFDRKEFIIHVGMILRATFKFGFKSSNLVWSLRCRCLQEKFVVSSESVSSDQFINKLLWKENIISLSQAATELFLGLERILQSLQNAGLPFSSETVVDLFSKPENMFILNQMRTLSQGLLSEDLAIDFLGDFIKSLSQLSGKLDARKKAEEAKRKQVVSTVSLRTNLKRDPKHTTGETQKKTSEKETPAKAPTKKKNTDKETPAKAPAKKKNPEKETPAKAPAKKETPAKAPAKKETPAKAPAKKETPAKAPAKKETPAKAPAKKKTPEKETPPRAPAKKKISEKETPATSSKADAPRSSSRQRKSTERFNQ